MLRGKLNISIDGQFGSTGKGLLNSVLAKEEINVAVTNAAPNAGHTFDVGGGKKTVFHLPVAGVLNPGSRIYLCAGSIIDPELLANEIEEFGVAGRVYVHPRAAIVTDAHKEAERDGTAHIASTQKGVGAALADKVTRRHGVILAGDYDFGPAVTKTSLRLQDLLNYGETALMEVPQGFGLSINHGLSYPHCTSRDLTIGQSLNDAGVHPHFLGKTYLSLRTFPIRVGNIMRVDEDGHKVLGWSGPFYPDSDEKTWDQMGQTPELTTVTKRVRRVATFSMQQYKEAARALRPDIVFVNFCNYIKARSELEDMLRDMRRADECADIVPERWFGFGPHVDDVVFDEEIATLRIPEGHGS